MTTDWAETLEQRATALTAPVPGAAPGGIDVRYDPAFEALAQELGKLDAPQATAVDWKIVERDATTVLSTKSKDILVACWLAASLHEQHGLEGLALGLWVVGSIVDSYWDGLFPPLSRMKARTSAVTWLVTRTVARLETHSGPLVHDVVDQLAAATKRFQRVSTDRFAEHAPGTRPLGDAVERLRLSLAPRPAERTALEASATPPVATPPSATPPVATPPVPTSAAPAPSPAGAVPAPTAGPSHADLLEARVREYLAPIPGAAPAGIDGRYDPQHEALRAEIAKLDDPGAGAVAWATVASRGATFLENTSKDVLIASYVAWARFELDGLDGLSTGLALVTGLVGGYWDGLHPTRIRPRANALTWLIARVEQMLGGPPPKGGQDRLVVERLSVASRTFAAIVRDKFGDDAPGLRPLLGGIERLKLSLPSEAPPTPPAPAPVAPAPVAPAPAPVASPAPALSATVAEALAAGAEITPFLQQIGTTLSGAATTLRSANASDPNAYRLRRLGLYMAVQAAPPAAAPPKTQVPGPQGALRKQLAVLHSNAKWAALIDEAESALSQSRFWLDLQRYVVLALDGLGHASARDAVLAETTYLLRRFPSLPELMFSDATPFASPDTREWLDSIAGQAGGAAGTTAGPSDDPTDELLRAVKAQQAAGKRDEAMKAISAALRTATDERSRFRLRLAAARVCAGGNAFNGARALFAGLVEDIDQLHVAQWDPALAAEVLRAYHEALREPSKTNPHVAEEATDVYRRLCRIDPLAALG